MNEQPLAPTEQRYNLKCKIVAERKDFLDSQSKGEFQNNDIMVMLLPQESTQRDLFFDAWMPHGENERFELTLRAGHPINGSFRAAFKPADSWMDKPYLFVMSQWAEKILALRCGTEIEIEVFGEQEAEKMLGY